MKIHALYSEPHYAEHVRAVWKHLPQTLRGNAFSRAPHGTSPEDVVMVGGYGDIDRVPNNWIIYVEHGAGQSYGGDPRTRRHDSYHGARHPDRVIGYISPRHEVADAWGRPAIAAGAPVCDDFPIRTGNEHPAVAITFHWECRISPETRSALPHYEDRLEAIVAHLRHQGYVVLGHHHPRDHRLPKMWRNMGVEIVDVDTVRRCADLLIADNTSLLYEMAYLGRNVVTLNAPWFRRDIHHGLRFWSHIPGIQVDDADELIDEITHHADHAPSPSVCRFVYGRPISDGRDGVRAADWVTALVAGL